MLFSRIRALLTKQPEDYARAVWKDALTKSGAHAYRRFLASNPREASSHLAKLCEGFVAWAERTEGLVYICTHPAFPGKVKIGCTLKEEVVPRVRGLRSAGVIGAHTAVGSLRHFNARGLEAALHQDFRPMRVEREWFSAPVDMALALLHRHATSQVRLREDLMAPLTTCAEGLVQ